MNSNKKRWDLLRKKPRIKEIFIFFIISFFSIYVLEFLAFKILDFRNPIIFSGYPKVRYIRLREWNPLESLTFTPDEQLLKKSDSLVKKAYRLRIDDNGFIEPSKVHNNPDCTIVFLGGSTTENVWVEEKNRFPYVVGRIIEQKTGKRTNSYNGGYSGNHSLHSINILLNKIIPLNPDIVVMEHNFNDLIILLYEKTYWNNNPSRSLIVDHIRDKNIKDEFVNVRNKEIDYDKERLTKEFMMNLQTFIDICRDRGIIPVLMTQENRFTNNPDGIIRTFFDKIADENGDDEVKKSKEQLKDEPKRDAEKEILIDYELFVEIFKSFNEAIREIGNKNNVLVIDLARMIPQKKEYIFDIIHLNDKGSQLAAEIIGRELIKILESEKGKEKTRKMEKYGRRS